MGATVGNDSNTVKQSAQMALKTEQFNRQLHPDEKQRIKDLAKKVAKEQGGSVEFWTQQLTLVASAMVDKKENQQIIEGLTPLFEQDVNIHQASLESYRKSIAIALDTLQKEANKNEPLKWKDGSDIVLFNESVKMFQATEKQYQNAQMFGEMAKPIFPTIYSDGIGDYNELNGLEKNSKYTSELSNIVKNNRQTKQDNQKVLSQTYHNYFVSPTGQVEPVAPELMVLSGGTGRVASVAVSNGGKIVNQTRATIGEFASKYPNVSGTIVDGGLSGSTYVGYKLYTDDEINGYELSGAIATGALSRNHTLGNQIRINVGVATAVGLSKEPNGKTLGDDYVGAIVSPIIGKPLEKIKYGNVVGGFLSEYGSDVKKLEEGFNNFQKFIKDKYENK